jgi:hypothetical protein
MKSTLQVRDWLNTWLGTHASAAWSSNSERLEEVEDVVTRLRLGTGRPWRVERGPQMTSNPGDPPGQRMAFSVVNADDGGVYTRPSELRARSIAGALNALEDHLKKSRA